MAMIIPGIVSVTFRDKTAEWIIERCQMAKLGAVEWSEKIHVFPDDENGAAALGKKTTEAGLAVAAYGSYYRLGEQDSPKTVFLKSLKSAAALKAPIIRIWAGVRPSDEVGSEEFDRISKEAALAAELAAGYNIKVALEWHKDTLTDTNESAIRILQTADHPNLYCLWQPTAALSVQERVKGLDLLGSRILNLHIYYWPDGVKRPLAEGLGEWQQYLRHIDKDIVRYGLMEFVMDGTEEQFLQDAQVLHRMLKNC